MAGLLVLAHENICQISSRGRVFRPQVKGPHECLGVLVSSCSSSSQIRARAFIYVNDSNRPLTPI